MGSQLGLLQFILKHRDLLCKPLIYSTFADAGIDKLHTIALHLPTFNQDFVRKAVVDLKRIKQLLPCVAVIVIRIAQLPLPMFPEVAGLDIQVSA